jgi:predicted nuclease with TOPRIM domain
MNYVYIAVGIAFISLVGLVKYQDIKIEKLELEQTIWTTKNNELADRIEDQNKRLKEGEEKYNDVQTKLNVAAGKNKALSDEFAKLRGEWKGQPIPKNCEEAIVELKSRSAIVAGKWNGK